MLMYWCLDFKSRSTSRTCGNLVSPVVIASFAGFFTTEDTL
jgi:hypothetical protein